MNTLFENDNAILVGPQAVPSLVVMGANAEFISRAADTIFAGTGHSTIIAAGYSPGYPTADTVVLNNQASSSADVLLGAGDTVFGGAGHLVLTFTTGLPSAFVPGTGSVDVLNDPTGAGIDRTHEISRVQTTGGLVLNEAGGGTVHLWTAGPVA